MILSYESLLREWVSNGSADKIISILHNKNSHMDFFLSRDSQELLNLIKEGDRRTLLALLRCFDEATIQVLRESPQSDDQKDILFDIDTPDALTKSFLQMELNEIISKEKTLVA